MKLCKKITKGILALSLVLVSTPSLFCAAVEESVSVRDCRNQLIPRTAEALAAVDEWCGSDQAGIVVSMAHIANPRFKAALDYFFGDPEVGHLMRKSRFMMEDGNQFSHTLRTRDDRSRYAGVPSPIVWSEARKAFEAAQRAHLAEREYLLSGVLTRHPGIERTSINSDGIISLIFPGFEGYKVEIALYDWPIVRQGPFYSEERFVLHDLAAALHAKSINDVIETQRLGHIDRVDTQLYRLPWVLERALNDHDFVVVTPYHKYGTEALITTYADLLETQKYLREQIGEKEGGAPIYKARQTPLACSLGLSAEELDGVLVEIIQVITGASIWCVGSLDHANIILYRAASGELRAAFTNIRRPAFGSSEAKDFYQKESSETLIQRGDRFGMGGALNDAGEWQSEWYGFRDMLRDAGGRRSTPPSGGAGAGAGSSGKSIKKYVSIKSPRQCTGGFLFYSTMLF